MSTTGFKLTKLSNLNRTQINQLIALHKQCLPNSLFSIQKPELCNRIYKAVAFDKRFFNIVITAKNKPLGLLVGRLEEIHFLNLLNIYDYCIWYWTVLSKKKRKLITITLNIIVLTVIKTVTKRKYWIDLIYIDKSLQGKGIGTELLKRYKKSVPSGNKIWVDTERKNKVAIAFYLKNNFVKKRILSFDDLVLMYEKL